MKYRLSLYIYRMICKLIGWKNFLNESIRIKYQVDDVKRERDLNVNFNVEKEQSGETSAFRILVPFLHQQIFTSRSR